MSKLHQNCTFYALCLATVAMPKADPCNNVSIQQYPNTNYDESNSIAAKTQVSSSAMPINGSFIQTLFNWRRHLHWPFDKFICLWCSKQQVTSRCFYMWAETYETRTGRNVFKQSLLMNSTSGLLENELCQNLRLIHWKPFGGDHSKTPGWLSQIQRDGNEGNTVSR